MGVNENYRPQYARFVSRLVSAVDVEVPSRAEIFRENFASDRMLTESRVHLLGLRDAGTYLISIIYYLRILFSLSLPRITQPLAAQGAQPVQRPVHRDSRAYPAAVLERHTGAIIKEYTPGACRVGGLLPIVDREVT